MLVFLSSIFRAGDLGHDGRVRNLQDRRWAQYPEKNSKYSKERGCRTNDDQKKFQRHRCSKAGSQGALFNQSPEADRDSREEQHRQGPVMRAHPEQRYRSSARKNRDRRENARARGRGALRDHLVKRFARRWRVVRI
jgi:hypothetical protein